LDLGGGTAEERFNRLADGAEATFEHAENLNYAESDVAHVPEQMAIFALLMAGDFDQLDKRHLSKPDQAVVRRI